MKKVARPTRVTKPVSETAARSPVVMKRLPLMYLNFSSVSSGRLK